MKNFKLSNLLVLTLATTITGSLLAGCVGENNTNSPSNQTTATTVKSTNTQINNPENLPCGVDAIMTQMEQQNGYASASDFFNKAIFSNADGACKLGASQGNTVDCSKTMYTYNGLVAASQYFPKFACQGNLADRVRDVSAFFANVAQETYGGSGTYDNNGGLYWRIENSGMPNPAYDPNYLVNSDADPASFCQQGTTTDPKYIDYRSGAYTWNPQTLSYAVQWMKDCPSNFTNPMVNILGSGNWIGHGAIQLTGDSIYYGTQEYNTITKSNLTVQQYADGLVNNDLITWFSALAYWTTAKPNQASQQPAEYYVVNDSDPDFGFGNSIYKINGGCNNADQRTTFFKFFENQIAGSNVAAQDTETPQQLQCSSK